MEHPILWSFRRCPYAMRARLGLQSAGVRVELREILLRDKPVAFLETSPSATVPCLRAGGQVIDESLDIMTWALEQNDPEALRAMPKAGWDLIATIDGPFKQALDHTKYAARYPDLDPLAERQRAASMLAQLEPQLNSGWLFGPRPTIADFAILPFVRQFANTDLPWFNAQPWPALRAWLTAFLTSPRFGAIMDKHKPWSESAPPIWFGGPGSEYLPSPV